MIGKSGGFFIIVAVLTTALSFLFSFAVSEAADVIVIGDIKLKPVVDIVSGIKGSIRSDVKIYSPSEVRGGLDDIIEKEGARTVIALGKDAMDDALRLPSSVPVIYGLVIAPPKISRPNTTGIYMATPVGEYVRLIRNYLPSLKKLSVVSSQELLSTLGGSSSPQIASFSVSNSFDLIKTVKQLNEADALLLLPDVSLLTNTVVEEIYLFSFRKNIPLLGISERYVKNGALLALVFDPVSVGRQIGEIASEALNGTNIGRISPAPSRKFELYINSDTSRKMGIRVPEEMLKEAKMVYP